MGLWRKDPLTEAINKVNIAALNRLAEQQERAAEREREADDRNRQN